MAYTFDNTKINYETWGFGTPVYPLWVGSKVTGVSSGATGWLVGMSYSTFGATIPDVAIILLTSVGGFSGNETVNIAGGGSFILAASRTSLTTNPSIMVTGSLDTDSSSNLSKIAGAVGMNGGYLLTTITARIPATGSRSVSITVADGTNCVIGETIQIDNEPMLIDNKTGNSIHVSRCQFGTIMEAHEIGASVYRNSLVFDVGTNMQLGNYYRMESEYFCISGISTNGKVATVRRGAFGSTIAQHAIGTDIYLVDEALLYQCYKASVDNGWGYATLVNNKMQFGSNVVILIGNPDQTSRTIALSKDETAFGEGSIFPMGGATYDTWFQSGIIVPGDDKLSIRGSNLIFTGVDVIKAGIGSTRYGQTYLGASDVRTVKFNNGGYMSRVSGSGYKGSGLAGGISTVNYDRGTNVTKTSYWHDILEWAIAVVPSSPYIDYNGLTISEATYAFLFIFSGADAFINGGVVYHCDSDGYGFADGGNKHFINSTVNLNNMGSFWAEGDLYTKEFTINIKTQTKNGLGVPNVSIKCNDNQPVESFDVDTDANGNIVAQTIVTEFLQPEYEWYINYNPFKYSIRKAGWAEEIYSEEITVEKNYVITLKNKNPESVGTGQ